MGLPRLLRAAIEATRKQLGGESIVLDMPVRSASPGRVEEQAECLGYGCGPAEMREAKHGDFIWAYYIKNTFIITKGIINSENIIKC